MHVHLGTYRALTVKNFDPIQPPNPECCNQTGVMCPKCAVEVLRREGFTANSSMVVNASLDDDDLDDDTLPIPTINWQEGQEPEAVTNYQGVSDDDDILPLPTINWAEEVANRQKSETRAEPCRCRNDDDGLPLPSYDWAEWSRSNQ